jgi:hypothetical protein
VDGGEGRRMMEGIISTTVFYKNFCKCPNITPEQ